MGRQAVLSPWGVGVGGACSAMRVGSPGPGTEQAVATVLAADLQKQTFVP